MAPIDQGVFNSTTGLLAFAAFLQAILYLAMVAIQYEAPYIGSNKYTMLAVQYGSPFVLFFTAVGMIVFSESCACNLRRMQWRAMEVRQGSYAALASVTSSPYSLCRRLPDSV